MTGSTISRENIGIYIVAFDLLIMIMTMLAIWIIEYYIRLDVERHQSKLFETSEFTVEIWNLPKLHEEYSAEILKSDIYKIILD